MCRVRGGESRASDDATRDRELSHGSHAHDAHSLTLFSLSLSRRDHHRTVDFDRHNLTIAVFLITTKTRYRSS